MSIPGEEDLVDFDQYPETSKEGDDLFDNEPDPDDPDFDEPERDENDEPIFKEKESNLDPVITTILSQKGFANPNKIKIINEDGAEEVVTFESLSDEEKLSILNAPDFELDESEIEVINFLRSNNTTLEDIIKQREQEAVKAALAQEDEFTVDAISDEELFVADLKSRYPNLTDEELANELDREMGNDALFRKKADTIREQYKQMEQLDKEERSRQAESEAEQEYEKLSSELLEVAQGVEDMYSLELEDQDKDDVLRCLLEKDTQGQSKFIKLLEDPKMLFRLAWFAEKGDEAFDTIHQYYKKEIETARRGKPTVPGRNSEVVRGTKPAKNNDDKFGLSEYLK